MCSERLDDEREFIFGPKDGWEVRAFIGETLENTFHGLTIISASDVVGVEIPEIEYYIDKLLRPGGRLTVVASKKMGKSLFAIDFGLHIAEGRDFLGFPTKACNVLYVNFEIADEKLQERLQEIQEINGFSSSNFFAITISQGFKLDKDTSMLDELLDTCKQKHGFPVEVLILDPRVKTIIQDENQSTVLRSFADNIDGLLARHDGLSIFIVHHVGKGTKGSGRGSSVYDGWVDTTIKLLPKAWIDEETPTPERFLLVEGRDTEEHKLGMKFTYPKYELTPYVREEQMSKLQKAKSFIIATVEEHGEIILSDLKLKSRAAHHSDWAFQVARNVAIASGEIVVEKAPGQGNRKKVKMGGSATLTQES